MADIDGTSTFVLLFYNHAVTMLTSLLSLLLMIILTVILKTCCMLSCKSVRSPWIRKNSADWRLQTPAICLRIGGSWLSLVAV